MKFFLFLALFTGQAFALDVCQFDMTNDLEEAIAAGAGVQTSVNKNHGSFSPVENLLIHSMVKQQDYLRNVTLAQALDIFADYNEYKPGPGDLAGELVYYTLSSSKKIVIVHYWPGDNEYGAIFEVKPSGIFNKIAVINDSDIICK